MLNLPSGHARVDGYLRNPDAHPLPTGHILLESLVSRRSLWSPGLVLTIMLLSIFCAAWLLRLYRICCKNSDNQSSECAFPLCVRVHNASLDGHEGSSVSSERPDINKTFKISRTEKDQKAPSTLQLSRLPTKQSIDSLPLSNANAASLGSLEQGAEPVASNHGKARRRSSGHFERKANVEGMVTELPPPRSLEIHQASLLHAHHIGETGYEIEETRASTIVMPNTFDIYGSSSYDRIWNRFTSTRIPRTDWSTGNAIFCLLYIILNILALLFGAQYSGYAFERGLGSLAAANTAFLIVPATR